MSGFTAFSAAATTAVRELPSCVPRDADRRIAVGLICSITVFCRFARLFTAFLHN
jgi:hypothetical protein